MLSQQPAGALCPNVEVAYTCSVTSTVLSFRVTTTTPTMQEQATFLDRADTSSMTMFTLLGFTFTGRVTSRSTGAVTATLTVTVGSPLNGAQVQCIDAAALMMSTMLEIVCE